MKTLVATIGLLVGLSFAGQAWGQESDQEQARPASLSQEQCIAIMSGFPSQNQPARYQFFKLAESLGAGATPAFRAALKTFGAGRVSNDTPVTDVIEGIANPVLRQAEPALVVGQTAFLVNFAHTCRAQIAGQISSLQAFDPDLKHAGFNAAIAQDALFLRQILSDVLFDLKANEHLIHGAAIKAYAKSLVSTRNNIEYKSFESDVADLEVLFMGDLDDRLARSNDVVNGDMNAESVSSAVAISNDMTAGAKRQEDQRSLQTLINILNSY